MENDAAQSPASASNVNRKQYYDKKFKKNLTKALKQNFGEPGNLDRIQYSNRTLNEYSTERITDFINRTSVDIQKSTEISLPSSHAKKSSNLATFLASMPASDPANINNKRCDELTLAMKLCAESNRIKCEQKPKADAVDFVALNKFLYTAVSGNPDVMNPLNEASIAVLADTLRLLETKVDAAVASHKLDELKSRLFQNTPPEDDDVSQPELSRLFQNPTFNPLSLPVECCVHEDEERPQPLEDDEMANIKLEGH